MPFYSIDHVRAALSYMSEHTHPTLMSVLAMLRHKVLASDDENDTIAFGSPVERKLMQDYFHPRGGPEGRPYFIPFGPGGGLSHWREASYPSKSLQRQRTDRKDVFRQHPTDNKRWSFVADLGISLKKQSAKVVGDLPISTACLAAWFYREREITTIDGATELFADEFNLASLKLVPEIFSLDTPAELISLPLSEKPIDDGELLIVLQEMEPEKVELPPEEEPTEGHTASAAAVSRVRLPAESPGDWNVALADLQDLCGLHGVEEAATRALAALAAGFNVIFTGPPGAGKTTLAECVCLKAGFPTWTVPATDQWTTFETIGGYFRFRRKASRANAWISCRAQSWIP